MSDQNFTAQSQNAQNKTAILVDIFVFLLVSGFAAYVDYRYVPAGLYQGFLSIIGAFFAALTIIKMRGQRLIDLGLTRPRRFLTLPLWVAAIFVVTLAVALAGQIIAAQFIAAPVDVSKFAILHQNLPMLVFSLISIWITAAFFEEIVYRGFLLGRLLDVAGGGLAAVLAMSFLHAVLFGLLHIYQGPLGVISTGIVGFVFGIFFALQGRNLWALILVHGLIDTLSVLQFYFVGVPPT
ncbi:MAG: type II CAAX endopeptidase family protein [Pseudomonadota bacterium]